MAINSFTYRPSVAELLNQRDEAHRRQLEAAGYAAARPQAEVAQTYQQGIQRYHGLQQAQLPSHNHGYLNPGTIHYTTNVSGYYSPLNDTLVPVDRGAALLAQIKHYADHPEQTYWREIYDLASDADTPEERDRVLMDKGVMSLPIPSPISHFFDPK